VPAAYAGAMGAPDPATAATQVTAHPDGRIEVSPPGSPPPGVRQLSPEEAAAVPGPPAIPMTPERVQGIMDNPVFRPMAPAAYPGTAASGAGGTNVQMAPSSPYVAAMGGPSPASPPAFEPDVAALRAAVPGLTDEELQQALAEYQAEIGVA
jgi:hypothetical protein